MNPWETISLFDYEQHMSLACVNQLQAMNELMKQQLSAYPVEVALVFGIAGGNGLKHIDPGKYKKVYGIDINEKYLDAVRERYSALGDTLSLHRIDVVSQSDRLPEAELVIANLFIEYIGYAAFQACVLNTKAKYVSCVIQVNPEEATWVSDSPFLHSFDCLDEIHHRIEEKPLTDSMKEIGYMLLRKDEYQLPNKKKLVLLDYARQPSI